MLTIKEFLFFQEYIFIRTFYLLLVNLGCREVLKRKFSDTAGFCVNFSSAVMDQLNTSYYNVPHSKYTEILITNMHWAMAFLTDASII